MSFLFHLLVSLFMLSVHTKLPFCGTVVRGYVYSKTMVQGTAPLDSTKLKTGTTTFLAYVECEGAEPPTIQSVFTGRKAFTVKVFRVGTNELKVGRKKNSGKDLRICVQKNHSLWGLDLSESPQKKTIPFSLKKKNGMIIEWKCGKTSHFVVCPIEKLSSLTDL